MSDIVDSYHFESLYPPNSREIEIAKIFSYIKEGNSCQLVSLAGAGRSNLLGMLSFNRLVRQKHVGELHKAFHFVYLNFSEIKKKPLVEAVKFIFLSLTDSLRDRQMAEEYAVAYKTFTDSLALNDELVLFQGLKRVIDLLALEKELTIVFLFDRFEEYVPMLTSDFFTNLRILRNRAKYHFSVVISLNRPLEDLVEPDLFADFYELLAGHVVYLPIQDEPGQDFRISYLEKTTGKTIDKKLLSTVLELTKGHGKLTRLSLEAILSDSGRTTAPAGGPLARMTNQAQETNLLNFLLEQKTVRGALYEIWRSLIPVEQKAILSASIDNVFLTNIGLVKDGKIQIPLFAEFVRREFTGQLAEQEHLSFDPNTRSITKGDLVLSDKLTAAEFRLLEFLLGSPDRIIERDELIGKVWQDTKTTAGVTDQAIDQLVFRLRRKIESDPNSPQHLQTVKGRGFRFVP